MEYNQMILPNQIREVLNSNEIAQIQLKDGTVLQINDIKGSNYIFEKEENKLNEMELEEEKEEGHSHHKGGIGYFGHHFKTEYNELCPDCLKYGGVIKKRKNYVLYVSKNCSESDVALKHKSKKKEKEFIQEQINNQIQEQIQDQVKEQLEEDIEEQIQEQIKENIEEQIQEHIEDKIKESIEEQIKEQENKEFQNQEQQIQGEEQKKEKFDEEEPKEIIMEVEYNSVPIIEEKIILKKDENKDEEINNLEQKENVYNEGKEEQNIENEQKEENINNEIQREDNNINNV